MVDSLAARVELQDHDAQSPLDMEQPQPLLPLAVSVYGCLHLLDNIPKAFPEKLEHWRAFHAELQVMSVFLRHRQRRERFVQTCLGCGHAAAPLFESFSAQLLDHRWFSVFAFVTTMRPLLPVLQRNWSTRAFQLQVDGGAPEMAQFDLHQFASILTSPLFHCYCTFVHRLGKLFLRMVRWLEGCPCHGPSLKKKSSRCCPLASARAPELAAGALQEILLSTYDADMSEVMNDFPHEQLAEDLETQQKHQAILAGDISLARAHVALVLEVKMDPWRRLPLRLAALAHPKLAVRAQAAEATLGEFDRSLHAGVALASHHHLSRLFLEEGLSGLLVAEMSLKFET